MGSGLNFFANAIDVAPAIEGSWQDVDVSSHIPVGATGVILYLSEVPNGEGLDRISVRKNGSSDDYYAKVGNSGGIIVGVDANRVFEAKVIVDSIFVIKLIGYTDSNVILFDNGIDKSTGTTGSYQDVDVSGDGVLSGATGAIFFFYNASTTDYDCALRKNGSGDDIYAEVEGSADDGVLWGISGLDASRVCEQKIEHTDVDLKLIGYTKLPVIFFDNAEDVSLVPTGSWEDIDLTGITEAVADGAIFSIINTAAAIYDHGLQRKDSTDDDITEIHTLSLLWRYAGLNSGQVCEGYIEDTSIDFFVRGYCKPAKGGAQYIRMSPFGINMIRAGG